MAQISTKIPNAIIAGMGYWLLLILIVGICVAGTGILVILTEIKVIGLYKKNCWDVITLLMILTSAAVIIYFGEAIKKALSVNLLLLFLLLQGVYVGIRCYLESWLEKRRLLSTLMCEVFLKVLVHSHTILILLLFNNPD